jgi:glycosyltransferase involved in cell wall biosynthesis
MNDDPVVDDEARALAGEYDADYYASHLGAPYRRGDGVWEDFFAGIADAIVAGTAPRTVLDAGCGIGFLVAELRKRDVDAYGIDISEYAISQVPDELRPFVRIGSVTEELDRDCDLIVCIEVLEHLPGDLAERAIDNLTRHTSRILFSSSPTDVAEPTHYGVRPPEEWIELFARRGFFRDTDLDATSVAPQAVWLTRATPDPVAVARGYERWSWQERVAAEAEAERLRAEATRWREEAEFAAAEVAEWELFKSRSGYRIFVKLGDLRAQLAPRGTARDRVTRNTLRGVANLVDRRRRRAPAPEGLRAVLFMSDVPGDSRRYRCDHQAAELGLCGATVDVADYAEVNLDAALAGYAAFVLHRVPWSTDLRRFIEQARAARKPVVFDTDDLVFEPEAQEHIAVLRALDKVERAVYVHGLKRFRRTMRECDGVFVSTDSLRVAASRYNDRVEVAYNAVSDEMVAQADEALATASNEGRGVTIGYFSGTPTHDVDFLEAADAILWALERYPRLMFRAVGTVTLDPRFDAFGHRVQRLPLQPWSRLPALQAATDVNLAPLERNNPFTDSKSCLKYIEAGLVGRATIASSRSDFVRAIEHGRNGLLADSPAEWRDAIATVVESDERRRAMGEAAYEDVRRKHTVRARSRAMRDSLASLVGPADGPLTINVVATGEFAFAHALRARGHTVRVYTEPAPALAPADVTLAADPAKAPIVEAHDRSLFKLVDVVADSAEEFERVLLETCFLRQAPTVS